MTKLEQTSQTTNSLQHHFNYAASMPGWLSVLLQLYTKFLFNLVCHMQHVSYKERAHHYSGSLAMVTISLVTVSTDSVDWKDCYKELLAMVAWLIQNTSEWHIFLH